MSNESKGALVVAVGPGDREIDRLRDLLDSLRANEPRSAMCIAVNDPAPDDPRDLKSFFADDEDLIVLQHPGHTRKEGWSSGLAMGLMTGMAWAEANTDVEFIVKVDTDSLVIGPFVQRLSEAFAEKETIGMLGSAKHEYNGRFRDHSGGIWEKRILNLRKPLWIRHPRDTGWDQVVRTGWDRAGRYVRKMVDLAMDCPTFVPGDSCQGGGYAVHRRLLSAMRAAGDMDRIPDWGGTFLAEDILMGIVAGARGYELADATGPGGVFGVTWKGLPAPPEELLETGCAVVHSLRQDENATEDEFRAIFKAARENKR